MKIFNASLSRKILEWHHELFSEKRVNVLRSFGVLDGEMSSFTKTHRYMVGSMVFDAGTWTLNNTRNHKIRITEENYIEYLKDFGGEYDFYAAFDWDFNDDGFENNLGSLLRMEEAGLKPVPVVHDVEGDEIPYYIERGYPWVALGSRQIKNTKVLQKVVEKFEGTGIRIHLFGNKRFEFLANYPIHSCDTVGWANEGRYGSVYWWNPNTNKADEIYLEDFYVAGSKNPKLKHSTSQYKFMDQFEDYLRNELKLSIHNLLGQQAFYNRQLANLHFIVVLEEKITEIHHLKGFNTDW